MKRIRSSTAACRRVCRARSTRWSSSAANLGPQLAANHIDTRIWILDHNYNLWGRAIAELDDPKVNRYVGGVAWHGYVGNASAMTHVHEAHPDKHMY